jgi:Rrf2 family transcriptional regulator, cysteine metabolism repressor
MASLAAAYPEGTVSVRELGEQLSISPKYLEQILRALKASGLIEAVRGKQGGYALGRPPQNITLREVYGSLVGSAAPACCVDEAGSCPIHQFCPTRDTWIELKMAIEGVLERTTVQVLAERKRRKAVSSAADYVI